MNAPLRPAAAGDRLGVTLLFSLILHAVVILGITFRIEKPRPSLPALDVTLLNTANGETPLRADFLAQANNAGGGDNARARLPGSPTSGPLPEADGAAPRALDPAAPQPQPISSTEVLTQRRAPVPMISISQHTQAPAQLLPVAVIPIEQRLEMARLAAEVRAESQAYAKRPRRKFISANTREYAYAAYMRAWVARIERVGNLNYPDQARRRELHGQLVLTVGLHRDGSIASIDVIKGSGYKVLDDAAIRIVHLAAPFPPLPAVKNRVDELYITRTWQFLPGNVLRDASDGG